MNPNVLLLTSNDGTQSGRSGYDVIADYLNGPTVTILKHPRAAPKGLLQRALCRLYSKRAASAWYLLSSRQLEKMALKTMNEQPVDLVHLLWGDRDWGYLDRETKRRNIPFVCTTHACPDGYPSVYRYQERLKAVDAFILMSSHQRNWLLSQGVPEERIHVIHHGIDVDHFKPLEEPPPEGPTFRILSVGHTRRNFPLLKELIQSMEDIPCCEFHIISSPRYKENFQNFKNVRFESNLSNEDLLRAYQHSSANILTAEDSTANNALLESLACGVPVVAEAVGGIPEYGGGSPGLILCKPNNVQELKHKLLQLMESKELRNSCAAAARERAMGLRWEISTKQIWELYRSLC